MDNRPRIKIVLIKLCRKVAATTFKLFTLEFSLQTESTTNVIKYIYLNCL